MLTIATFPLFAVMAMASAQDPEPTKEPDKEIAEKIEALKDVVLDRKTEHDEQGVKLIDELNMKMQAGVHPKDKAAIVKALEDVFFKGKLRAPDHTSLYAGAAAALGYCGEDGAKVLRKAYDKKRFPDKKEWVPLREQLLKYLGRTKDESMVKFLCGEARRQPEAALQAAAGEALGNFEESKEEIRKEIVGELLIRYGELAELASQMGSSNIEAQNAQDRLAALSDKWNTALAKLTRQNFTTFRDWQAWHNKNRTQPW
ncbi:MAG: hypothetical protein JNM25_02465 [Planctomycetes bacterium]|nr:hypothetical protein [Planctomycetota bacterium]